MQFVDEQNDLSFGFGNFLQHRFQAVFKFAAVFRAGDQRGKIQCHQLLGFQHVGHVAGNDALRQSFDDGGLAHAWFADQHGIIFGAARENLHDAANFFVAADDRIEFRAPRQLGQIARIFFQRRIGGFGILRSDALAAAHPRQRLQNGFMRSAVLLQQAPRGIAIFPGDGQKQDARWKHTRP